MSPPRTIEMILESLERGGALDVAPQVLDDKTRGLVGIGAAVSMGASTSTYRTLVGGAIAAGATLDECIGAFLAVATVVGGARMVTAAPRMATALGYDMEAALE
jgi:alkylhydroperoxidase/carboxymuconolactone decarboxylase family protein YurZ